MTINEWISLVPGVRDYCIKCQGSYEIWNVTTIFYTEYPIVGYIRNKPSSDGASMMSDIRTLTLNTVSRTVILVAVLFSI